MHLLRNALPTLLLLVSATSLSASTIELDAKPVKRSAPDYETISYVTEGAAYGHTDGAVRGRYHRIVFISAGLAYDRPRLRFETLTYGDEACCKRVISAAEVDLDELREKGIELPPAATTTLRFRRWLSPQAVELEYGTLVCSFSGVNRRKVVVACK